MPRRSLFLVLFCLATVLPALTLPAGAVQIDLQTDNSVASNQTTGTMTVVIGGGTPMVDEATIQYAGEATGDFDGETRMLDLESAYLDVTDFSVFFQFGPFPINADLEETQISVANSIPATVAPDGSFVIALQLQMDTLLTGYLGDVPVAEDMPFSMSSDLIEVEGVLVELGDTDGDGKEEFDVILSGPLSYTTTIPVLPPLIEEATVTVEGVLDLGLHGEAAQASQKGLELLSPDNGATLTQIPRFDWTSIGYDWNRIYLVLPFEGKGYVTLPFWTQDSVFDMNATWYPYLWWAVQPDTWAAWVVLAVDTLSDPPEWEVSEVRWFKKAD